MKPTMLLAFSFIHFALITIAIFPSGAVVAQPTPATVVDIYCNPVVTDSEYYIYEPRGKSSPDHFRVIGLPLAGDRVHLYGEESQGIPAIISQGNRATVEVDTALKIRFSDVRNFSVSPFWKVSPEPDLGGNYLVTTGGYNECYEFKLAQNEYGKSRHLYYLTYTTISPFCKSTAVGIGLVDSYLVAKDGIPFQFQFVPVEQQLDVLRPN